MQYKHRMATSVSPAAPVQVDPPPIPRLRSRRKVVRVLAGCGLVGGAQTLLQNRRGEVATTVEISGRASDPETSTWALVVGLIQNAFVKAIAHGFEPQAKDASP
jgi:hypothetical protein